jgi:hypothetical protein
MGSHTTVRRVERGANKKQKTKNQELERSQTVGDFWIFVLCFLFARPLLVGGDGVHGSRARTRSGEYSARLSISTQVNRGVAWAAGAQAVIAIADAVSTALVIALWVSTDDFGVVMGAIPFYTALDYIADFGVGSALIQHDDHTPERVSTVFWFNMLVSGALFVVLLGLGRSTATGSFTCRSSAGCSSRTAASCCCRTRTRSRSRCCARSCGSPRSRSRA